MKKLTAALLLTLSLTGCGTDGAVVQLAEATVCKQLFTEVGQDNAVAAYERTQYKLYGLLRSKGYTTEEATQELLGYLPNLSPDDIVSIEGECWRSASSRGLIN